MNNARRGFLLMTATIALATAQGEELFAQFPRTFPGPPAPAEQKNSAGIGAAKQETQAAQRAALQ